MTVEEIRFEALVDRVHDPLVRYLRRRSTVQDAEEVMSEVLLTLWRRLDAVPQGEPLPWCYAVARRALANHRRAGRRRLALVDRLYRQPRYEPEAEAEHPELTAAVARLSEADRELILLWSWEGLEPREIAQVLDTTPNAVSLRLSRLKRKIAATMRQNEPRAGHREGGDQEASP